MPYLVVTLHTDGSRSSVTQKKQPDLSQLQSAVGGFIETVPHLAKLTHEGVKLSRGVCYCNEEGQLQGLPFNEQATQVWLENLGKGPFRYPPRLHGPCIYYAKVKDEIKSPPPLTAV